MSIDKSVVCPVLIGRENELQLLDRIIAQAGERRGQVAVISGEAGIGKSRLVKEAKTRVSQDRLILEGHCFQTESALPYAPLLDLFRNFHSTHIADAAAHIVEASAPQLARLFPEWTGHALPSNPTPDPKQEQRRLFQALIQTFTELAQSQPLIVIIEDLHWSDSTSLEFLQLLARRIAAQPILLLLTYRSEETTPELTHFLAELDRERLSAELMLKPMSQPDVESMLRAILDLSTPVSKEFLDTLFPLTEGNPFFIEEILKALITDGDIFYADGTWDRKEISQLRIPRTIKDAVQRRTQHLDARAMQVLTFAAVTGRRFDFRLLQQLLAVNEMDLMTVLKQLVAAQLVEEETADHFAFRHALIREATYTTLLLRERQAMHRQVGEVMEQVYADAAHSHLAELSYHYFTGGVWTKALEYSQKAGDQARTLSAQREAIVFYSRALVAARELNIPIDPALLRARGQSYEILGDFRSALDDFEHGLKLAQQAQNGPAEWQTLLDLGYLWAGRDYQQTGEYFRRAEALAQQLNDPKLQAQSLNRLGNWYVNIGQTEQGLVSHHRALAIFENAHDEQGMAETCDLLGMATLQYGDQVGSFAEYQHAISLFRKLDDKHGLISALTVASTTPYWDESDRVPPLSSTENQLLVIEGLELAHQLGWVAGQAFAEWCLALSLAHRGLFGEALTHGHESLQLATEIDHRQWITGAHFALGSTYVLMLQTDLALQHLEKGLLLARELGSAWWLGNLTTTLANAHLLNMDLERAQALLGSVALNHDGFHTLVERRMFWAKGKLLLAQNKPAEALHIADRLLDSVGGKNFSRPIPALSKLKGEALMALQRNDEARQELELARLGAEQREALPLLWQIHAQLGWLHKAQKDLENSEREFSSARQVVQTLASNFQAEDIRAQFIQRASESLPKERTVTKRQSETEKFGGLTPRERDVARFLSQGKSNREIAEVLVLSERTVENHVGNILAKLGFDSRAQVAVWAVEKGLVEKN